MSANIACRLAVFYRSASYLVEAMGGGSPVLHARWCGVSSLQDRALVLVYIHNSDAQKSNYRVGQFKDPF